MKNGEFFYKDMADECEPFYYNPKRRILDLLDKLEPNPVGGAKIWREKCRQKTAEKNPIKPCAGMDITYGGHIYKLIKPAGPRRGWIAVHGSGNIFRLPVRAMAYAVPV
jgi:hypothetical protein